MAKAQPVLIAGSWRDSDAASTFNPVNPKTELPTGETYPVSSLAETEEVITAAAAASDEMDNRTPEQIASFLNVLAARLEGRREDLVVMAEMETGFPAKPRLDDIELPRTTDQLRQAASAAVDRSWTASTIDTQTGIRSYFHALEGGVSVFGPNNFPFAFNSVGGGDFAAAIAAGNPVVSKANSSHPGTTRLLAEEAHLAAKETDMPAATVQLIYRTDHEVGKQLVSHPLIGATGYTGSRSAGLTLKQAADAAGKPIYLELSSINPVVILPGALQERSEEIADEFTMSCLMGTGQFCTNPGIILLLSGDETEQFVTLVKERFEAAPVGTLLSDGVQKGLETNVSALQVAGAESVVGGKSGGGTGFSFQNTILRVDGTRFLQKPEEFQREAFGNESLFVVATDLNQATKIIRTFEGNLTGCIYSNTDGSDEEDYQKLAPALRRRVGRLLNDKMPTGVAVTSAMNHGGPYPATGHPGFTAVGIPASLSRFAMLQCFDNVRNSRLPTELRDDNPKGIMRFVDGSWTSDVISHS